MRKTWERTIAPHTPDEDAEAGGQGEENRKKWITMRRCAFCGKKLARMFCYPGRAARASGVTGEEVGENEDV